MLKVDGINKTYNSKQILKDISFTLGNKEKAGIVGNNGIGKSTLIKIILGSEKPDSGSVLVSGDNRIGYLSQELNIEEENQSVEDFIKKYIGVFELEKQIGKLEKTMNDDPSKIQEYCDCLDKYNSLGGYDLNYKMKSILNGFGLVDSYMKKNIRELSGGQKSKVMLAGVLLKGTDLLLLDEPTNNLDLKAIEWLENYLNSIDTTCLIVSHDRRLLNKVVTKILEIDYFTRTMKEYSGNYKVYHDTKEKEQQKLLLKYTEQQETISNMENSIIQKKNWAVKGRNQGVKDNDKLTRGYERDKSSSLASNAKKIEKQIEQMEKVDKPKIKNKLNIEINSDKINGGTTISTRDLICGYKDAFKTRPITININFGDRIIIIGENGSGKSTFLKTLIGQQKKLDGEITVGSGLNIGYISQDTKLNSEITLEDFLKNNINYDDLKDKSLIYTVLNQFNFLYDDRKKKYNILSPGERTRLQLAVFSMKNINTLILDEPTNHLDIEALEALEEVISNFKGTVIAVSHDREFITDINPTKVYDMKDGKLEEKYRQDSEKKNKIQDKDLDR